MFDPLGSTDVYSDDFVLMVNEHLDIHQVVNDDGSYTSTKNIKDLTAVPIGNNTYAYIDSEKIPTYLTYDDKIEEYPLVGYSIPMDKVRFHFVSGFDFNDFKALLLSIKHTENDGKSNLFANILLAPETDAELISFNPKPMFLGNALYDRFIEFLVPSIKNINEEYRTSPTPAATFAAAVTPNSNGGSTGFVYNGTIYIGLAECGKKRTIFTDIATNYDAFEVTEAYEAPLSQTNEFDSVGASISESTNGDFIEFYMTYYSGFPADMIAILNNRNPSDDWIIIHQLSVFEQIGTAFINTSRQVFFQETDFDEPNVFRPVLKNANEAVSMTIELLCRLTNRLNGEQIIREASFSLISPKKYGKSLTTIALLDKPQSQKIYNKLIQKNFEATTLFIPPSQNDHSSITPTTTAIAVKTEYVPVFFNNNNISVSSVGSMVKVSDSLEEVVFGPGQLRFILSPFDNFIKLKVFTTNSSSAKVGLVPLDLNVNSSTYRLVFETSNGKLAVNNTNDANLENPASGIIAFNVSKKDSETILQSASRIVYLISAAQDGTETLIYSGEWRKTSEQADVDAAMNVAKEQSESNKTVQKTLDDIAKTSKEKDGQTAEVNISASRPIKGIAVAPVVNRFGVSKAKSIKPNSNTAGKSGPKSDK